MYDRQINYKYVTLEMKLPHVVFWGAGFSAEFCFGALYSAPAAMTAAGKLKKKACSPDDVSPPLP